ncbi:MAG: right-handed parallel beta-helix repeat-containing protein [Bacteroidia bacterium]|nr:right-handed parallel beta-helix repeat-containing protein [Bacteroidia bacterium]
MSHLTYAQTQLAYTTASPTGNPHIKFNDIQAVCEPVDNGHVKVGRLSPYSDFRESEAFIVRTDHKDSIIWQFRIPTEIAGTEAYFTKVIQANNGWIYAIGQINNDPANPSQTSGLVASFSCDGGVWFVKREEMPLFFNDLTDVPQDTFIYICGSREKRDPIVYAVGYGGTVTHAVQMLNGSDTAEFTTINTFHQILHTFGYEYRNHRKEIRHDRFYTVTGPSGVHPANNITDYYRFNISSNYFHPVTGTHLNHLVPNDLHVNPVTGHFLLAGDVFDEAFLASSGMNTSFVAQGTLSQSGGGITNVWEYDNPNTLFENKTLMIPQNIDINNPSYLLVQSTGDVHSDFQNTANSSHNVDLVVSEVSAFSTSVTPYRYANAGCQWVSGVDTAFTGTTSSQRLIAAGLTVNHSNQVPSERNAYKLVHDAPFASSPNTDCRVLDDTVNSSDNELVLEQGDVGRTMPSTEFITIPHFTMDLDLTVLCGPQEDTLRLCVDENTIVISSDTIIAASNPSVDPYVFFYGKYYVDSGVTITVAAQTILDITNVDMIFDTCSGMIVNGRLRANNSVFRTCDEYATWKGIQFNNGSDDNKINECTFKNAEVALNFNGSNNPIINSNTFLNNKWSIYSIVSNFNNPIANNHFTHDAQFRNLKFCGVLNGPQVGFMYFDEASTVNTEIFGNRMINNGLNPDNYFGIIANYSSINAISSNVFSNLNTAVYILNGQYSPTPMKISNNQCERLLNNKNGAQIMIQETHTNVLIDGNTVRANTDITFVSGIEIIRSSSINVIGNTIEGFYYGVYVIEGMACSVNENLLKNQDVVGILIQDCQNTSVRCNTIDVNHRNYGIINWLYSQNTAIESNCVLNSFIGLGIFASTTNTSVLNNYFYNYRYAGVYNGGEATLNIGLNPTHGQNTFVGHNPAAPTGFDVYTAPGLTTLCYNNYDLFDINFPHTQIVGPSSVYSTASCGHQLYNVPNTNQPLVYRCDEVVHFPSITPEELVEILGGGEEQGEEEAFIHRTLTEQNSGSLAEFEALLEGNGLMDANEKQWYEARKAENKRDYESALHIMSGLEPSTENEKANKLMYVAYLKGKTLKKPTVEVLTDQDYEFLSSMYDSELVEHNEIGLVLLRGGKEGNVTFSRYELPEIDQDLKTRGLRLTDNFIEVYPNPGVSKVSVTYSFAKQSEGVSLTITNVLGNVVYQGTSEIFEGTEEIDISSLVPGLYVVTVQDGNERLHKKFMKE